jgi:hypothetical protein
LNYRGKAIYLPPKHLKDPETYKAFLSKRAEEKYPEPNLVIKQKNQLFIKNPEGILFTPPGAKLTKLFEKRLGINFALANLNYFKQNLPKLLIDDLEIAENIKIEIKPGKFSIDKRAKKYGIINVKITNSIFKNIVKENPRLSEIHKTIGSPISSAIACALTKVTGRPLIIEDNQFYEDGNIIEVTYKIEKLEYTEPFDAPLLEAPEYKEEPEAPLIETPEYKEELEAPLIQTIGTHTSKSFLPKLISISMIILGVLTLVFISQLTWDDMILWNKDLGNTLLMYRTGEPIGLGIGMKFIHYFMIGSALLFSGTITFLQKGRKFFESLIRPPLFPRIVDLFFIVFGAFILVWISELVLYELVVWHKSFDFILFAYGTNEPMGLGIGMKTIYYFMIGLALLLSGILTYQQRKKNLPNEVNLEFYARYRQKIDQNERGIS